MADDEEAGWTKVQFRQPVHSLLQDGLTLPVQVSAPASGRAVTVSGQIDTGASGSAMSPRVAEKLGLEDGEPAIISQPGSDPQDVFLYRVRVTFLRFSFEIVAGTVSLPAPHDFIIGRDVLSRFRIEVDFTRGLIILHRRDSS